MAAASEYGEIENVLEKLLGESAGFENLVEELAAGKILWKGGGLLKLIGQIFTEQIRSNGEMLGYVVLLVISAAFLSVVAKAFRGRQISDMGFYMIYLLLFLIMMRSFGACYTITERVVEDMISFMKVLMPSYLMAVAASAYRTSAVIYYEGFFFMIYYIQKIVAALLLPGIRCYVLLTLLGYLVEEEMLEKGRELLKKGILLSFKLMVGVFSGMQAIQAMVTPAVDEFKNTMLSRGVGGLGRAGNIAQNVTDIFLGSGNLIKNGIGAAGAVFIIVICLIPLIRVFGYVLFYQILSVVAEPICDKRLTGMVSKAGEGIGLLMKLLFAVASLFLLTIAIVCVTTGGMG